jgi:hypothetical protein
MNNVSMQLVEGSRELPADDFIIFAEHFEAELVAT